ncbi:MAG: hypothetical protein ACRDFQ_06690 [Anaerolineales bacterium]
MKVLGKVGIALAIAILSIIGDIAYSNAARIGGQTLDLGLVITLRPIILFAFYIVILIFAINLLTAKERNLPLSIFFILFGLFVVWMSGFAMWFPHFPRTPVLSELTEISSTAFQSIIGLTLSTGVFFTVIGFLRLLRNTYSPGN